MKEPCVTIDGEGRYPFSVIALWMLEEIVFGIAVFTPTDVETDEDFYRRYAAILLKERGL